MNDGAVFTDPAPLGDSGLRALCPGLLEAAELAGLALLVEVGEGASGRTAHVNEAAARLLRVRREELLGEPMLHAFALGERSRILGLKQRRRGGEDTPLVIESMILRKDGSHVPVEIAVGFSELEGRTATFVFVRDLTERRHADDVFRKLIVTAPDAVTVAGREILYANPRYLELLGYSSLEELRTVETFSVLHPDDRARAMERVKELRGDMRLSTQLNEYRLFRKDGSLVNVDCSSLMIEFEGVSAVLTFIRDVTQRREIEAQLIQTDRMATIGTLAAGVAHEVNNPLGYVMLNLGLLERELDELVREPEARSRVRERLAMVQEGTSHIASIVRDLRSFCRADSPPRPVDVRQVLESAINMAMTELAGRARLVRDYRPVRPVLADGARLGQVFLNLLLNAAQSLTEGPPEAHEIRVTLQPEEPRYVTIEIKDTGHGIEPRNLDRIFEPFFTTKPPGLGTGLGLSISQSIVHGMMGQLTVESEVGRGSLFRVRLPT